MVRRMTSVSGRIGIEWRSPSENPYAVRETMLMTRLLSDVTSGRSKRTEDDELEGITC